jgi:hypothetical protein
VDDDPISPQVRGGLAGPLCWFVQLARADSAAAVANAPLPAISTAERAADAAVAIGLGRIFCFIFNHRSSTLCQIR